MGQYSFPEKLTYQNIEKTYQELQSLLKKSVVTVNLEGVILTTAAKGILRALKDSYGDRIIFSEVIELEYHIKGESLSEGDHHTGFLERIGDRVIGRLQRLQVFLVVLADMFYYAVTALWDRRFIVKYSLVINSFRIGYQAISIVALLAFLIGLTISVQAAVQMAQFGGQSYLAMLITVAMFKELGPLITAIMVAGRTGSSIAAEIGTMVAMEEVDALQTMGIRPLKFLLVPKFWAFTLTMPILVLLADFSGVFGGMLVALIYDVPISVFYSGAMGAIGLMDILWGTLKGLSFAWAILSVAAYQGLQVRGGSDAVGKATTNSVVISIFMVVIIDAIFSVILYM